MAFKKIIDGRTLDKDLSLSDISGLANIESTFFGTIDTSPWPVGNPTVIYSLDGKTWTGRSDTLLADTAYTFPAITAVGNGIVVAMAKGSDSGTDLLISTDGISWDKYRMPITDSRYDIAYSQQQGRFVVSTGGGKAWDSLDGITWTQNAAFSSAFSGSAIAYGAGTFVVLTSNTFSAAWSSDGTSWNTVSQPYGQWTCATYGDGTFVAMPDGSAQAIYSKDKGVTWTLSETLPVNFGPGDVAYGDGKFVAVKSGGGSILSTDGINWIRTNLETGYWLSVKYADGKFVAVGRPISGYPNVAYSYDGSDWVTDTATYTGRGLFVKRGQYGETVA